MTTDSLPNTNETPNAPAGPIALTLGGRRFLAAEDTTLAHDVWMMQHVQAAGLHQVNLADPEAVLARVLRSGRVMQLLGGSLVEEGVEWTAERAEANAAMFAQLRDPAEKARLQGALVGILLRFFASGAASWETSLSSSSPLKASPGADVAAPDADTPDPANRHAPPTRPATDSASASGARSLASSPAATPNASEKS